MRRALVVLLALGMASAEGAADRPRPPGAAAAPSPDPLITGHQFEPWRWSTGEVVCMYFDPEHPTRGTCDRPESEHGRVEDSEVSGDPGQ